MKKKIFGILFGAVCGWVLFYVLLVMIGTTWRCDLSSASCTNWTNFWIPILNHENLASLVLAIIGAITGFLIMARKK